MNTHSITYIQMAAGGQEASWKVKGSPWSTLTCPWLIAHDLFHHAPGDLGSVQEELASIGAEFYVNYERSDMSGPQADDASFRYATARKALSASAGSIVGMQFEEGVAEPENFVLTTTDDRTRLAPDLGQLFTACALSAVDCLAEHVLDDEGWAQSRAHFNVGNIAKTMHGGYLAARRRFPDREAAHQAFASAVSQLSAYSDAPPGTQLTVERMGLSLKITVALPC